jgi:hypothetical protein
MGSVILAVFVLLLLGVVAGGVMALLWPGEL